MKDKGASIKVTLKLKDFIDNTRATRRSKIFGTDRNLLSQKETLDLIVNYFKRNSLKFQELIKMEFKNE